MSIYFGLYYDLAIKNLESRNHASVVRVVYHFFALVNPTYVPMS